MSRFFAVYILVATLITLFSSEVVSAASEQLDENEIKAAYLYNFAKYVEWPKESAHPSITFCVTGSSSFNTSSIASLAGKTIKNRKTVIKEMGINDDISDCNLLFINASAREKLPQILRAATENSILTVSDIKDFTGIGGIIELVHLNNKIRFRINNRAAKESALKISSRLLSLAVSVSE